MIRRPDLAQNASIVSLNLAQNILVFLLRGYRSLVSPALTTVFGPMGFGCRFSPTCSCYALEAVKTHGALRGSWMAIGRIGRCHPWGGEGNDPVPPRKPPTAHARERRESDHHGERARICSTKSAAVRPQARATHHLISSLHGS